MFSCECVLVGVWGGRYQYYQTATHLTVTVLQKDVKQEDAQIDIQPRRVGASRLSTFPSYGEWRNPCRDDIICSPPRVWNRLLTESFVLCWCPPVERAHQDGWW